MMAEGMGDMFSFGRYTSLDLDVTVPQDCELEVTDSSGDIELSDVGASGVTDSSGDMLLKNINGDLQVNDSCGRDSHGQRRRQRQGGRQLRRHRHRRRARRREDRQRQLRRHRHRQGRRQCPRSSTTAPAISTFAK